MKEELKVGIVGANRGSSFMLSFTETSETKATAICDINEDPLQEIGGKFSINQRFTQYEEDYEDSDSEIVDLSNQALTDTRAKDNSGMGYVDWWRYRHYRHNQNDNSPRFSHPGASLSF